MTAHSKVGASSMHRWSNCPGSVRLSEGVPKRTSSHAEEGTLAHEVAAALLEGHSVDVPEDMVEHLDVYTTFIRGLEGERRIEHRFNLDNLYKGAFGTADAVVYNPATKTLHVVDLKYGVGVGVEVANNPQLMFYGLGALLSTGYPCETVDLVIVQPRFPHPDGPVRRWSIEAVDLFDFAADLVKFAKATEPPDAPLTPGDWCRWCPASGVCPAIRSKAQELAKVEFSPRFTYDPKVLAETLHFLPILETWAKATREFAYGEAEHGRTPPGWKLVEKRPTRKWIDENQAAGQLAAMDCREDEIFEKKIISPAKAEKLLGKPAKLALADLTVAESSGYTLAPEADKRPAVRKDPKSEFEVVQ